MEHTQNPNSEKKCCGGSCADQSGCKGKLWCGSTWGQIAILSIGTFLIVSAVCVATYKTFAPNNSWNMWPFFHDHDAMSDTMNLHAHKTAPTDSCKGNCPMGKHTLNKDGHGNGMRMSMNAMTQALINAQRGAEFDEAFLREMIAHHEGALTMAALVAAKSDRSELKKFAQEIIETQTQEIATMKKWQQEWSAKNTDGVTSAQPE